MKSEGFLTGQFLIYMCQRLRFRAQPTVQTQGPYPLWAKILLPGLPVCLILALISCVGCQLGLVGRVPREQSHETPHA
jgi:hypothetical protein